MRDCLRARRRLWAYLDRPDREPEVGDHLRRCPTCAAAAARLEREGAAFRDAAPLPPLPDADRMWAAIAPQLPRRRPVLVTALIPLAPAALAALLWLGSRDYGTTGLRDYGTKAVATRDQGPGTRDQGQGDGETGRRGGRATGRVEVAAGGRLADESRERAAPRREPVVARSQSGEGRRAGAAAPQLKPVRVASAEHDASRRSTTGMGRAHPLTSSPAHPFTPSPAHPFTRSSPRAAPLRLTEPEPVDPGAPVAAVFVLHAPARPPEAPPVLGGGGGAAPALQVTHTFCRSEVTDPATGSTSRLAVTREVDAAGAPRRVTIEYVVGPPNREGTGRET